MSPTASSERARGQEGFTLAALIVILTIISIVIAYTVPTQWSLVMRRERDRQTIFLMKQYARGIMEWQKKHQSPPTSLEQLREAKEPRFLRGKEEWPCPLTGSEEDWILVPPQALIAAGAPTPPGAQQTPQQMPVPPVPGQPGVPTGTKLNKEASPPDYEGPFVAVRPKATGKSLIALNGVEVYDEWVYSVQDLQAEIMMRQMLLQAR